MSQPMNSVSESKWPSAEGMKCPNSRFYFVNFLTWSFPVSNGNSYILLVVDYVSRWVEAKATKTNDVKVVVDFLKSNIFCRFGVLSTYQ
ncbi:hypothetical protein CR513_27920, partial [Mucuna pruriens]